MRWQWYQPDHMQIICTSLQTDNHASTLWLSFLPGRMLFLMPNQLWFVNLSTSASNLKNVDITQQIVAIYPQPLAGWKPKPTVIFKNCSHAVRVTVHSSRTQHSTEQFWQFSILSSKQSSLFRQCLLEERGVLVSQLVGV